MLVSVTAASCCAPAPALHASLAWRLSSTLRLEAENGILGLDIVCHIVTKYHY